MMIRTLFSRFSTCLQHSCFPGLLGMPLRVLRSNDSLKIGQRPTFSGLSLSSSSRVEEAADVGEQGCNAEDSNSDNVRVGSHVAQCAISATSCLHLNCWRAQRLACRCWSCAHEAKQRGAAKGQHQEGEQRTGAGHCKSWESWHRNRSDHQRLFAAQAENGRRVGMLQLLRSLRHRITGQRQIQHDVPNTFLQSLS